MELKTLTWSDFDQHRPCYSPAERYGEWSGTILDLLQRDDIPAEDRLWAATRDGILNDKTLRLYACRCVRAVWHLLTDERSRKAVEVAERYAVGEATDDELDAAMAAASAAMAAARAAARAAASAAWVAARAAASAAASAAWVASAAAWDASAAAWDAARAAAWDARAAAWDAAKAAAWVKQVEILIHLIEEGGKQ